MNRLTVGVSGFCRRWMMPTGLTRSGIASGTTASGSEARGDLIALIGELTEQMHAAAAELQFEVAARIRDEIKDLKHELRGMQAAGV